MSNSSYEIIVDMSERVTWIQWNKWRTILKSNHSENKFPSSPKGVKPMAFQNTSWTLLPLSYGGLLASKVANYVLIHVWHMSCYDCKAQYVKMWINDKWNGDLDKVK